MYTLNFLYCIHACCCEYMELTLKSLYNLDDELEIVLTGILKVKKLEDLNHTLLNRTKMLLSD